MSNWIINYTKSAYSELDAIYKYIAEDLNVPNTASKQIKRITNAIDSLDKMPLRNPLYDKEPWHSLGLRKMLVDNYIVFYFPNETNNEIVIMHIFYSGRNILDILK